MNKWIKRDEWLLCLTPACFTPACLSTTWSLARGMADHTYILKCNTSPFGLSMHLSHHLGESTHIIEVHHFQSPTSDTSHNRAGAINGLRFLANLGGIASRQPSHPQWEGTVLTMLVSCSLLPPTAIKNPRVSSGSQHPRACWASPGSGDL